MPAAEGFRFRPPALVPTVEAQWVLSRAFGPLGDRSPASLDYVSVVSTAAALGLQARIARRCGEARLRRELGPIAAAELMQAWRQAIAVGLLRRQAALEVARTAADAGLPVVLLKFAALVVSGSVELGSRTAVDVDFLARGADAETLYHRLEDVGFHSRGLPGVEQHLPILGHPTLGSAELHHMVLGVHVQRSRPGSATLDDLADQGLLESAPGFPNGTSVPARDVLVAHALVHGLAQHGLKPRTYSLALMLSDLVDLAAVRDDGEPTLDPRVVSWVRPSLSDAESHAALELCGRLVTGGDLTERSFLSSSAGALLRHLLAGASSPRYVESQKLSQFGAALTDRGRWSGLLELAVQTTLFPTRAQIDVLYGAPAHPVGYLARRLWRPFDLLFRLLRYSVMYVRHHLARTS